VQRGTKILVFQHPPEPIDLVRGLEKRVIAINFRVLSFNEVIELAGGFSSDMLDLLDVLARKQEMLRIDMAQLDEAPGFLGAAAGVILIDQATLIVHEAIKVATSAS